MRCSGIGRTIREKQELLRSSKSASGNGGRKGGQLEGGWNEVGGGGFPFFILHISCGHMQR